MSADAAVHGPFIGGEMVAAGEPVANVSPSDLDDVVGLYRYADGDAAATVGRAVAAAQAAQARWAATTPAERATVLGRVGDELGARKDELGRLLAREEGKTLPEAVGEVARAAQLFAFFAGEALRLHGEHRDSTRAGVEIDVMRQPVGVVGLITPWNFPIAIPAWKSAPALACGNAVVLKPSELAPGSAWALAEILARAGLVPGAFNLVMGGAAVGRALAEHPAVDAVSFTGSQAVGRAVAATCIGRGARVQLEMGGKNPLVVLDDADLGQAVEVAVQGAFFSTGQRCTASSRLVVTAGIHDAFVAALGARMARLRVDHALAPGTDIGPVVDARQLDKDLGYLALGVAEGAQLVGGERLERATRGHYLAPALFTATHNAMRINREEIFGPVASVVRVADFDEALAVANDTPYGLSAGVCTRSLRHAVEFKRRAQAGLVMVNLPTAGVDAHVPFGGIKGSSFGPREQGSYARDFYTTIKTCYVAA